MQNTTAKKRAEQEDVDSDYLFGNDCSAVPCEAVIHAAVDPSDPLDHGTRSTALSLVR
jgi:hypothetical protein